MRLATSILTCLIGAGCGAHDQPPNRNAEIAKQRSNLETYEEDDNSSDATAKGGSVFGLVCNGLGETDLLESPSAKDLQYFCDAEGNPTGLLVNKLPNIAYTPGAEVRLLQMVAPEHNESAGTTSMTVATAAKIGTTAKQYFEMMSVFMDDTDRAVDLGVKLIDGQTKNETVDEIAHTSKLHRKGWKKHVRVETEVSDQLVVSEYINRQDHWVMQEGVAYIINSYLVESIEGVVDGRLLTVILQGSSSAFIFTVIHTTTDNRGLPSVAQDQLVTKYKDGIRNAVANADKIKNEDYSEDSP